MNLTANGNEHNQSIINVDFDNIQTTIETDQMDTIHGIDEDISHYDNNQTSIPIKVNIIIVI